MLYREANIKIPHINITVYVYPETVLHIQAVIIQEEVMLIQYPHLPFKQETCVSKRREEKKEEEEG